MEPQIVWVSWSLHKIKNKMNPTYLITWCYNQTSRISFLLLLSELNHMNPEVIGRSLKIVKSKISTIINIRSSRIFYLFGISSARYS